jgi:hypothetical protein
LDGNVRTGFIGADGTKGIDNQYYRTAGCWMAWRGPQRGSHHAKYVMDGMRDGAFTALMVVSGRGNDPDNDNDVTVGFYASKDKMVKDANGGIAPDYSFRVSADMRYQSVVKARTVKGVLENSGSAEIAMHDAETAPFFPQQLKLFKARMRFTKEADGKLTGLIGGYRNIDDYYRGWAAAGAIHELTTHVNLPAYWYALRRNADAMPDPETKQNTAISTAYQLYLIPAFVTAPNDENEVTIAQLFQGPPPPETPMRFPGARSSGGGASTVYPPPPSFRIAREKPSK